MQVEPSRGLGDTLGGTKRWEGAAEGCRHLVSVWGREINTAAIGWKGSFEENAAPTQTSRRGREDGASGAESHVGGNAGIVDT
jgi:hypothetical protein